MEVQSSPPRMTRPKRNGLPETGVVTPARTERSPGRLAFGYGAWCGIVLGLVDLVLLLRSGRGWAASAPIS